MFAVEAAEEEADLAAIACAYSPLLFRVAHAVVRNRAEAEDVVQDVFVRVLQHRSKLRDVRDMRVWLVKIAWNLAVDKSRGARTEQMDEVFAQSLASRDMGADAAVAESERARAVLRAMDSLPRAEREALLLSAIEELSGAEVAKVMKRSESSVRSLVFRARTRLKERLEKGGFR